VHRPSSDADLAELDEWVAEVGDLPAALLACLREVGGVAFVGDCVALKLGYHNDIAEAYAPLPDPLMLPGVLEMRYYWERHDEDGADGVGFGPDAVHKANISGGTVEIELPSRHADPVLDGVEGCPGITLVDYLRLSIAYGGFPGWRGYPTQAPPALTTLRATPDF
jgi:hypothetical protein